MSYCLWFEYYRPSSYCVGSKPASCLLTTMPYLCVVFCSVDAHLHTGLNLYGPRQVGWCLKTMVDSVLLTSCSCLSFLRDKSLRIIIICQQEFYDIFLPQGNRRDLVKRDWKHVSRAAMFNH